jgi:hypothetical protein
MKLKGETVKKFWCPACKAEPGRPCLIEGTGDFRPAMHAARVRKAERMISDSLRGAGKTART